MKPRDYVHALIRLIEEGHSPKSVIRALENMLSNRHGTHIVNDIVRSLSQEINHGHHGGILHLETAHDASDHVVKEIRKALDIPKEARVTHTVEEKHIGGFRALYDNTLIDMTLESRLQNLQKRLLEASLSTS